MNSLQKRYQQFKEWKRQPHQVAPLSEEHHECATCGTHYEGNYCPRCGQSARIARYSFKNAFLLFMDVWGLGNRGMFRSIRDLLLRPGYLIRDYLRGMQMAYFPPFKMFFLILALGLLVDSGMNIRGIDRIQQNKIESQELFSQDSPEKTQPVAEEQKVSVKISRLLTDKEKEKLFKQEYDRTIEKMSDWTEAHNSLVVLTCLLLFSLPLFLLFRHSPAIPDIRFSECFVAMVYITNMILIYDLVPSLLCFSLKAEITYDLLSLLLTVIPIKQLSGYSFGTTIWRLLAALIPFIVLCLMLFAAVLGIAVIYVYQSI